MAPPRPLPARVAIRGSHAVLEPLHRRHHRDLWESAQGDDASWQFCEPGPFATAEAMTAWLDDLAARHDPMVWAVRAISSGRARGIVGLAEVDATAAILRLAPVWFGADLRRTRAGSETFLLMLRLAFDELGYRRVEWRCDQDNAPACAAASRLGFSREGTLRQAVLRRGEPADLACYGLLAGEWPEVRDGLLHWLSAENAAADGTAVASLAQCRAMGNAR
jgi:RimJ/RimL family protein N-acetyltransferase